MPDPASSGDPVPEPAAGGVPGLVQELTRRIHRRGSIPFSEFMEAALYHPTHGYYTCGRPAGAADFRTAPQIHPGFAESLASQVREMRGRLGGPGPFRIVELGPGDGALARAFLAAWSRDASPGWEYHLVEASPALREAQRQALSGLPAEALAATAWSTAEELSASPSEGVVLSNEFFDALPVHAVRRSGGRLMEVHVRAGGDGRFREVLEPAPRELEEYLERYGRPLAEGQRAEIGIAALGWVERIASMIRRGWVITVDYGHPAEGLFAPERFEGTLLGYHRHRVARDLLARVGEQDLTAHVNFTALTRRGEECGLRPAPLRTLTEFLLALGALERLEEIARAGGPPAARWGEHLAWKEVFVPGGLGETFRVLVQAKEAPLEGLRGLGSPWSEGGSWGPSPPLDPERAWF